jgi:hypothetical protein
VSPSRSREGENIPHPRLTLTPPPGKAHPVAGALHNVPVSLRESVAFLTGKRPPKEQPPRNLSGLKDRSGKDTLESGHGS